MACEKEKRYIEDKIAGGHRQFSRTNSYVQKLLNSANLDDVEKFIQTTGLRSMLY